MNRGWIAVLFAVLTSSQVIGQAPASGRHKSFSQRVRTKDGKDSQLDRPVPKQNSPLDYGLEGVDADKPATSAQKDDILLRMLELEKVVLSATMPNANPQPTTEAVINQLQTVAKTASGNLARDLENLLIASLNEAPRKANGSKLDVTRIWSFRRLDVQENWGPPIETSPNRVLFIPVLNLLDKSELKEQTVSDFDIVDPVRTGETITSMNCPHGFDVINLHTHGLNVSPNWPADNIFREIHPRQLKFFLYQVPKDQPAGTYFYHPHNHGSVASQVAGGMAGPLIVRDSTKGLDHLGKSAGWLDDMNSPLLIQQLSLYSQDSSPEVRFTRPDFFALKDTNIDLGILCDRDDVKQISKRLKGLLAPAQSVINKSDIETWVNGDFQPKICSDLGFNEIRRFRLIHGGVEAPIDFSIRPMDSNYPSSLMQVIAWDGIPLANPYFISDQTRLTLAPGNRADVLVSVPKVPGLQYPGKVDYAIVHRGATSDEELTLAHFSLDPARPIATPSKFVSVHDAARIFKECAPRLTPPALPNQEAFDIAFADASIAPDGTFIPGTFTINRVSFPDDVKIFRLNHSQNLSFSITGGDAAHPLHIHVNPFLVPADATRGKLGLPTGKFWADTFLIQPGSSVNVQMPFNQWTGDSVSHCHILDHEDAGMMNKIRIRPDVFSWPEFPVHAVLNMVRIPKGALSRMSSTWPQVGTVAASVPKKVSVFYFMPTSSDGAACPHCSESVQALVKIREKLTDSQNVRIVAITAATGERMPDPNALGLKADTDLLCSDPNLNSFESISLIDGTPIMTKREVRFPSAFMPNSRSLRQPTDLMHGLFIVDDRGLVVSSRRGFSAFDDVDQILHEIGLAQKGDDVILAAYREARGAGDSPTQLRSDLHRTEFEKRLGALKESAE